MTERNHQPAVNLTAAENEFDVDQASTENHAVVNVVPPRSRLGLLDIPPELRCMVYRELLVRPQPIDFVHRISKPLPSVEILRTSKLIYREASYILYKENQFNVGLGFDCLLPLTLFPRVRDTIRDFHIDIPVYFKYQAMEKFLGLMSCFGNPSIIRGTLTISFHLHASHIHLRASREFTSFTTSDLNWFVRALGRFTHFETIELRFIHTFDFPDEIFEVFEYLKFGLNPVLGHAEDYYSLEQNNLRFHPVDHCSRCREPKDSDWADLLDGLRLE